jgi:V/A-type H+/Na+-transporting ATPase subunit K
MYWLVGLVTISLVGIMSMGVYFEMRPLKQRQNPPRWLKGTIGANLILFVLAEAGMLFMGVHDAMAVEPAVAAGAHEVSIGLGLALIGSGIPTAVATIGAGMAVGPVGTAALAVIAEKPEVFGRSLVYLGLSEGIAIYGLVVTILMLGKIG